ncbi:MAG TPA: hypothetical protein PK829_08280, partial [Promineifilum sp.]|nr:hypothetical protein [Promineifilum sp.]
LGGCQYSVEVHRWLNYSPSARPGNQPIRADADFQLSPIDLKPDRLYVAQVVQPVRLSPAAAIATA